MTYAECNAIVVRVAQEYKLRTVLKFKNHKRSLGTCRYLHDGSTEITVNATYATTAPRESVTETILHELAHAIAGNDAGHGSQWKAVAIRLGAKPLACADMPERDWMRDNVDAKQAKFKAVCKCTTFYKYKRTANMNNLRCCKCKVELVWKPNTSTDWENLFK